MPPDPSAIHGDGWQAPWQVIGSGPTELSLEYLHPASTWPWRYRAKQNFLLAPDRLTVMMRVTNESDDAMPAGLGLHPYFLRTPQTRVAADVSAMWLADADTLPTESVQPPPMFAEPPGLVVEEADLDNGFSGWDGLARISWPEWQAELDFSAGPPFRFLQLYTPSGRDFFCFEPVSNLPDPFELADRGVEDTGVEVLGPGQSLAATVYFTPRVR
jgi:aldose 1-epimerase